MDHPIEGVCSIGHNNTYQLQKPEAISNKFDIVQPQGISVINDNRCTYSLQ